MKATLYILICLCLSIQLQAQKTPRWQTELYFEDGRGNRDTLTIALHIDATDEIDPEFGEVRIDVPFDSVLEVRGMSNFYIGSGFDHIYSNPYYFGGEEFHPPGECILPIWPVAVVHAKYPPLTVSWHREDFRTTCYSKSVITTHLWPLLIDGAGWWEYEYLLYSSRCMAEDTVFRLDTLRTNHDVDWEETPETLIFHYIRDKIEGRDTLDTLNIFLINLVDAYYPQKICPRIIDTTATKKIEIPEITIYPNPTQSKLYIEGPPDHKWILNTLGGDAVRSGTSSIVDVKTLSPGIYILNLFHDGHRVNRKVVVY